MFASIGVDFGGNGSAHSFVLNGFTKGYKDVITLDEFYLKKEISPTELEAYFVSFVKDALNKYKVFEVYADSAESTLIKGLTNAARNSRLPVSIIKEKTGPIINRIRLYNRLMSQGRYKVLKHCKKIIDAYQNAEWKPNVMHDERLDNGTFNIDSLDACEYSTENYADVIMAIE